MEDYRQLPRGSLDRFREQIGKRYRNLVNAGLSPDDWVVAVGDYTSMELYKLHGMDPKYPKPMVCIIDGKTKRNDFSAMHQFILDNQMPYVMVKNPKGYITWLADDMVNYVLHYGVADGKHINILVNGEEDLLTLSVIRHAHAGTKVIFGIPDEGVEVVEVTEEVKEHIKDLYDSMRKDEDQLNCDVAVAGTFACIHDGHKALLRTAISLGNHLVIGLTSDEFMIQTRKGELPDFDARRDALGEFMDSEGFYDYEVYPLHRETVYTECRTLVCSEETLENAYKMNRLNGGTLEIVVVPIVKDENGEKISASRMLGYEKVNQ